MLSFEEFKNRRREQEAQQSKRSEEQSTPWHDFAQSNNAKGYKAWRDWKGNVNLSNLNTGETNRFYQAYNHIGGADSNRSPAKDNLLADIGQSVGGALQRQGASYKGAGANLLLSMADLFNGKEEFRPEVGSALWRMQQGAKADMGVANQLMEDSKTGHGKAYGLVMDLTSGAVDLASDALLTAATGGASIGGKLGITAGLGAMGARSFGSGAMEAEEKGLSRGQQFLSGLKSATIEMLTEKIGGPFEKAYGASALGRTTKSLAERLSKNAGMEFALKALGNFASEGGEEVLSDVLNPLADKLLKLDNGEGWQNLWTADGFSQMAYDGLVGGLLGFFGGAVEGLSPEERAKAASDGIDNAIAANQQGKSIANELENDTDGVVAQAISNQASQTPAEGQQQSPPTQTPPSPQTAVKPEAVEFNAEAETETEPIPDLTAEKAESAHQENLQRIAEIRESLKTAEGERAQLISNAIDELVARDNELVSKYGLSSAEAEAEPEPKAKSKGRQVGKKTGRQIAWDAWFSDNVRQDAEPEGVAVDASDFDDEVSTTEPESGKVEAMEVAPTAAERLANYNNPQTTDVANRGLKDRVESAVRNALAQNGIDYSNDPRSDYYDENTGEYREEDLDLLDEESRAKYLSDMRQIRLLDAVDEWLDRNGQRYLSANKGSEAEVQQGLQDALNDYVRRYLDSQTDKASNSEAIEDVMQQRRQDDRLKSLAKEEKQKAPTGYNTVQVGNNLFRVTGPGGITTTEAADNSADAVQKHIDGLTEENRKKAKERKEKEKALKQLRKEVQESQENPTRVDGSDGKAYEVTKELTRGENNYQYVVTELDEDGLPTDTEARIFRKNADNEQEAVNYAIAHPEYFNDGSVEDEDWGERSNDGQTEQPKAGNETYAQSGNLAERTEDNYARRRDSGIGERLESHARDAKTEIERSRAQAIKNSAGEDVTVGFLDGDGLVGGYTSIGPLGVSIGTVANSQLGDVGNKVSDDHETVHAGFAIASNDINGRGSDMLADAMYDNFSSQFPAFGKVFSRVRRSIESRYKTRIFQAWIDGGIEDYSDRLAFTKAYVSNEFFAHLASGSLYADKRAANALDKAQALCQQMLIEAGVAKPDAFANSISVSDFSAAVDKYASEHGIEESELIKKISGAWLLESAGDKISFNESEWSEVETALNDMNREQETGKSSADEPEATNAKEYAYNKKLEAEANSDEAKAKAQSDEDKAKSTFGKDYDKVQKSADDFDGIKTRFDDEAFQKSDKGQDKKTRNKLKKLREAFREAATTGDVETLFSIYEDLQSDSNLSNFYNEEIQEDIDNWRKLSDPNLDSYNEGAAPYAAARTMQKMAHKFKLANEYQQTLSKMNETLRGSKSIVMRKIGKSEKLTSAVARALMRWQINPDTVFKMIDAFDKGNAGEGYKLAKELQEAHREKYRVLREARAKFDKASDLKGYQDFAFGKQTVKDYSGREWDMRSALSVIKAIDTIRSTSGKKLGGTDGFGVMDSKGNVEFIDMKDVDAIKLYESLKSGLSDVAIKYGELATEAFNDVKEPLRAKYKQNNGVDIGMVGDEDTRLGDKKGVEKAVYSPLSYVDKNGNVYQFDIAKQETYNNIPRFLRERSDAGGTYILIKPYTEVTGKYFEQVSNYLAYSTFNEKMRGLGKGSSYETGLGNTLADVFGKDMGNWYKSYVEDLATYQNEEDVEGVNSLLRQGRQQLQQGALLFSVSVPMKQISSYWAASGILHPDSLIKNYRIKLLKPKNSSDAATMLASRAMGNLEQSAAEAANDAKKWLGKLKYSSKFIELAANAINQMDYNTVSNLLSATEYDVLKYQFGGDKSVIGTDEYKAAVEEKFQDVVDRSQPNFDKQMRAEYGRTDNEVIRMLSMFRTQQTQNLNLLATAIGEYRAAKGTANQAAATETLKQTIAGQAASAFSLSMLTILADMLLHRQKKYEDEEQDIDMSKVLTRLGINAIEASSGTLWFGDAVAKWAIDRISGGSTKEFYGVNMGVISTVSDILENFETAIKSPTRSNIKKCAGNIATIMGIPLNNAYSMLNSAIMYAKDLTGNNEGDYDDILRYLDAQTKAAKKAEEKAAKEAAKAESKSGADMLADTAKQNSSQSELNSQEATEKAPVSGYLAKPYNALVEAGMSSQRSQEVLGEMDTDGNSSVKQSEMIAYYKAHPEDEAYVEAMWNSYGYKTTWEKAKQKAG